MTVLNRVHAALRAFKGEEPIEPTEAALLKRQRELIAVSKALMADTRYQALTTLYQDILQQTLRLLIWYDHPDRTTLMAKLEKYREQLRFLTGMLEIPKSFAARADRPPMPAARAGDINRPFDEVPSGA